MKEFANRKKHLDDKKANNEAESAKYSKCKAAESTSTKVCIASIVIKCFIEIYN